MVITLDLTCSYSGLDSFLEGMAELIEQVKAIKSAPATQDESLLIKMELEL